MSQYRTFRSIIDAWPADPGPPKRSSLRVFAEDIGVAYGTAQVMRHRDSIAPEHWQDVVASARKRKIGGVTLETLAELKAAERVRPKTRVPRPALQAAACR